MKQNTQRIYKFNKFKRLWLLLKSSNRIYIYTILVLHGLKRSFKLIHNVVCINFVERKNIESAINVISTYTILI